MNTHTRNFDLPVVPGGKIPAYDSETGVIQDTTSLRDLASYSRYLMLRSSLARTGSDGRQAGDSQTRQAGE